MNKVNKPNITAKKLITDFDSFFEQSDPYITDLVIENCVIVAKDIEGIEFINVVFRQVVFEEVVFEKCIYEMFSLNVVIYPMLSLMK